MKRLSIASRMASTLMRCERRDLMLQPLVRPLASTHWRGSPSAAYYFSSSAPTTASSSDSATTSLPSSPSSANKKSTADGVRLPPPGPLLLNGAGTASPRRHLIQGGEREWSQKPDIQRARRIIFGTHKGDGLQSGRKKLLNHRKRAEGVAATPGLEYDFFSDPGGMFGLPKKFPELVHKEMRAKQKRAMGKGPPKKGEGKRSGKKK